MINRHNIKNKSALVVGLGKSGVSASRLLASQGARVTALDNNKTHDLENVAKILESDGINVLLGCKELNSDKFDFAVLSPGVPTNVPVVKNIVSKGIPLIGELELGSLFVECPIIAITGTNGKTTTTELIECALRSGGLNVVACGNIGLPITEVALSSVKYDALSVEVSSFQLETIQSFKPKVSILTNITPDHLDRYSSMAEYITAKSRIFMNQNAEDFAVVQKEAYERLISCGFTLRMPTITYSAFAQDADVILSGEMIIARNTPFNGELLNLRNTKLRGYHNVENLMATLITAYLLKLPIESVKKALYEYTPAPHRLEFVAEINGVKFINDSKATNLDAVARAIQSFESIDAGKPNILLIAGGKDKGFSFEGIEELLVSRVKAAILIGETAGKILKTWEKYTRCIIAETLDYAVLIAMKEAVPGDIVLLSPACSSFDQFKDYKHRGETFKLAVERLKVHNM